MRRLIGLALAVGLAGCGGDSPASPTPATPLRADITVVQTSVGQLCLSPISGFALRLRVPIRITESGGLGANMNYIRLSLYRGGAEVERREAGTADFVAYLGTNRLPARSIIAATLSFDFNTTDADSFLLSFDFTDDRGNRFDPTFVTLGLQTVSACTI
jgi:hypothetical protein